MPIVPETINTIVNETHCNRRLARMVLQFTQNDTQKAIHIIETLPRDIYGINVAITLATRNIYGALAYAVDSGKKEIKYKRMMINESETAPVININETFDDFVARIDSLRQDYGTNPDLAERIESEIVHTSFIESLCYLLPLSKEPDISKVQRIFASAFKNVFADAVVDIAIGLERLDTFTINAISLGVKDTGDEEETEITEEVPASGTSLSSGVNAADISGTKGKKEKELEIIVLREELIVSPVSGKAVSELNTGDEVYVKITDTRELGKYIAELLGAIVGNSLMPIISRIIRIEESPETGTKIITTEFGPGVLGRAFVKTDVKIDYPEREQDLVQTDAVENSESGQLWVVLMLVGFVIILIILSIVFH